MPIKANLQPKVMLSKLAPVVLPGYPNPGLLSRGLKTEPPLAKSLDFRYVMKTTFQSRTEKNDHVQGEKMDRPKPKNRKPDQACSTLESGKGLILTLLTRRGEIETAPLFQCKGSDILSQDGPQMSVRRGHLKEATSDFSVSTVGLLARGTPRSRPALKSQRQPISSLASLVEGLEHRGEFQKLKKRVRFSKRLLCDALGNHR